MALGRGHNHHRSRESVEKPPLANVDEAPIPMMNSGTSNHGSLNSMRATPRSHQRKSTNQMGQIFRCITAAPSLEFTVTRAKVDRYGNEDRR